MGSVHDNLKRVRKPRVHLTYEVETGGAAIQRELPFVVGVLGDFSGNPSTPLKSLKDRKFVQIDRDNFDAVMSSMTPELHFKVDNKLTNDGSQVQVDLKFNSMDDFQPAQVAKQVEPLRKLLETRSKLTDLLAKVDRSEELEALLERVLQDNEQMKKFAGELGLGDDKGGAS
jgi:type VI secretion system protein ImpB